MQVTDILAIQTKAINKTITATALRKMLWAALARVEELEGAAMLRSHPVTDERVAQVCLKVYGPEWGFADAEVVRRVLETTR